MNKQISIWTVLLVNGLVVSIIVILSGCTQERPTAFINTTSLEVLDSNRDGLISPYEALDVLLMLKKEQGKSLSLKDFDQIALEYKKEQEEEIREIFQEMDTDGDDNINLSKVEGEMAEFAQMMDKNEDGILTLTEALAFNFEDALLLDEDQMKEEVKNRLEELDKNKDGVIVATEVAKDQQGRFFEWDDNEDGKVTPEELHAFLKADNIPVEFTVKGKTAFMTGVITAATPATVLQLLFEHPEVDTIEMLTAPGSIDDVANLRAALYIRNHGISTKLNAKSMVASGGTDFFLAGKHRIVEKGAKIGVHSWGGADGTDGKDVPKDDPEHQKYIDYYNKTGIPEAFYWYTLEVAPAHEMHWMTEEEIERYKVRTDPK